MVVIKPANIKLLSEYENEKAKVRNKVERK